MDSLIKFKVLIIGNSSVGKTSILHRHVDGKFSEEVPGTMGVDYRAITYERNKQRYDLQIWDTAGQERFSNITRAYYRNADAALLVFDLSNPDSFAAVPKWYRMLVDQSGKSSNDLVIILVGNKSDLDHRVKLKDIQQLATSFGITSYIQTSAMNGDRVHEVFDQLTEKLISKIHPIHPNGAIELSISRTRTKKQCC